MTSLTTLLCSYSVAPVIAIFTKFDNMDDKAFANLLQSDLSEDEARVEAPVHAVKMFETEIKNVLYESKYPPKGHVLLRGEPARNHGMMKKLISAADMNHVDATCDELISCTASAIDNEVLKRLFVVTQRNKLAIPMKSAVDEQVNQPYYLVDYTNVSLVLD